MTERPRVFITGARRGIALAVAKAGINVFASRPGIVSSGDAIHADGGMQMHKL
jgi:NAD(P)-dependent dehydrogenase (short-subunit alcohol dehydrogenase family)